MNSKRFYYAMLVLLGLSLLLIAGAYIRGKDQLQAESTEISVKKAQFDVSNEAIIKLQSAQVDDGEVENVTQLLDRLLPEAKEQDKLVADIIFTATAESGIPFSRVANFSFAGTSEPDDLSGTTPSRDYPGVVEYPFSLTINDITYDTLLRLLQEIETNGRIIQVDSIQISPDPSTGLLRVSLQMKAYLLP